MELISANRGVRPLNQPLETLSRNVTYAQMLELPRYQQGQITSVGPAEQDQLRRAVDRLLSGEIVINAPTAFWRRSYDWVSDRLVLKITDAKAAIAWFDDTFDVDVVYLTRHPVPQALSCIRNQWTLTTDAYLDDPRFVDRYLGEHIGFCRDIHATGSELERWVLNWAVENIAPLRHLPERPNWLHIRYEDCVTDPDGTLAAVAARLGLDDVDRMRAAVGRPSGSSRRSTAQTRQLIESGAATAIQDSWRTQIDRDDLRRADALLDRLGLDRSVFDTGLQ